MKGVFHLAGFNYGLSGNGEQRRPVPLPAPGSTFAASLHSSRFINLDTYSPSAPSHMAGGPIIWAWHWHRRPVGLAHSTALRAVTLRWFCWTPPFQCFTCYITANTGT